MRYPVNERSVFQRGMIAQPRKKISSTVLRSEEKTGRILALQWRSAVPGGLDSLVS